MRALGGYDGRRQVGVYLDLCSAKIASECAEREEEAETQHLTRTRRLETVCARGAFDQQEPSAPTTRRRTRAAAAAAWLALTCTNSSGTLTLALEHDAVRPVL